MMIRLLLCVLCANAWANDYGLDGSVNDCAFVIGVASVPVAQVYQAFPELRRRGDLIEAQRWRELRKSGGPFYYALHEAAGMRATLKLKRDVGDAVAFGGGYRLGIRVRDRDRKQIESLLIPFRKRLIISYERKFNTHTIRIAPRYFENARNDAAAFEKQKRSEPLLSRLRFEDVFRLAADARDAHESERQEYFNEFFNLVDKVFRL